MIRRLKIVKPGQILLHEFIAPSGKSVKEIAEAIGIPLVHVQGIIDGKYSISPAMCSHLSTYFGNTPQFWENLQNNYDDQVWQAKERTLVSRLSSYFLDDEAWGPRGWVAKLILAVRYRFRSFFRNLSNLVYYFPVIWRDRDWDWTYLLRLLSAKLTRMERRFLSKECPITAGPEIAEEIRVLRILVDRVLEHDYLTEALGPHDEKWGELVVTKETIKGKNGRTWVTSTLSRPNANTPELKEQERREFHSAMDLERELMHKDLREIGRILDEKLLGWWD